MPYNLRNRVVVATDSPKRTKKESVARKRLKKEPEPKCEPVKSEEAKSQTPEPEVKTKLLESDIKNKEPVKPKTKQAKPESQQQSSELETRCQLAFGADSCGELGLGKIGVTRKNPSAVPLGKAVKQVACGPMHTLSLTEDGQVYSYGCNDEGALGRITDGDEELEATPTVVPLVNKVIKISAGDSHSAALTDKDEVFVWGNYRDEHGSVGLIASCDGKASYAPIQLLPETEFKDIASGSNHMLLLDHEGSVYSFGVGEQGQLGRIKSEKFGENGSSNPITTENREIFLTPQKVSFKDVDPQRPFICDAIFAGNFSSFATNTDKKKNRLAAWGLNNYFQLGFKGAKGQLIQPLPRRSTFTCSTSMIGVACGQHHTLFLTKTGRVYSAGRSEYGMLGLGKVSKEVCPAKQVSFSSPVIDISAGINSSFAVTHDGKLYSWGMGGYNLGLQGDEDIVEPTEVKSLDGKKAVSVSAGGSFTSVVVE